MHAVGPTHHHCNFNCLNFNTKIYLIYFLRAFIFQFFQIFKLFADSSWTRVGLESASRTRESKLETRVETKFKTRTQTRTRNLKS